MSYRQGFIDALLFIHKECDNYSVIETLKIHCIERTLDKLSSYKVTDIKQELGISHLGSNNK